MYVHCSASLSYTVKLNLFVYLALSDLATLPLLSVQVKDVSF